MSRPSWRRGLELLATAALAGCAPATLQLYSGTPRPPDEVASVECLNLVLMSVDGAERSGDGQHKLIEQRDGLCNVTLLPGPHEFDLMIHQISRSGDGLSRRVIRFTARQGHRYTFWGIDKNDGSKAGWTLKIHEDTQQAPNAPPIWESFDEVRTIPLRK